jgi:diguanylate cyclase (GGDEF)-like protein
MEELVHQLADMCSLRDRYALDDAMVRLVYLCGKGKVTAVRMLRLVGDADDLRCLTRAEFDARQMGGNRVAAWKDWRDLPALSNYTHRRQVREYNKTVSAQSTPAVTIIPVGEVLPVVSLLELESAEPLPPGMVRIVEGIVRIYANYEALLDYGEKDALTELLNRKSFDGAFFKAATEIATPDDLGHDERRLAPAQEGYWLAVLDIDFFKRVNDNFGHLIGDEVLLLMARLMRNCFRLHDQLYRFGGEEFVILMRCANPLDAAGALERFRQMVEEFVFPQVGTITVSVGFAALRPDDTPGGAFDRADKAVYYAKGHGRNQVRSYENLLAAGELAEEAANAKEADFF